MAQAKPPVQLKPDALRWEDETLDTLERSELISNTPRGDPSDPPFPEERAGPERFLSSDEKMKWVDETKKDELAEIAEVNKAGAFTVPGVHTSYIEFHLEAPNGMSNRVVCNDCWLEFFIDPFLSGSECPACHQKNLYTEHHLPTDT